MANQVKHRSITCLASYRLAINAKLLLRCVIGITAQGAHYALWLPLMQSG